MKPDDDVRMMCTVNACFGRGRFNPPLPTGFYGNAFVCPTAVTTAGKLCENPLEYAVELLKKVKAEITEEYVHSVADLMVIKGRPCFTVVRTYVVSDVTHVGFREVDFGWGNAVHAGPARCGVADFPGVSFYFPFTNAKGEEGRVVPIWLPTKAMERFVKELDGMLKNHTQHSERR